LEFGKKLKRDVKKDGGGARMKEHGQPNRVWCRFAATVVTAQESFTDFWLNVCDWMNERAQASK
jgi:hypothetical protein